MQSLRDESVGCMVPAPKALWAGTLLTPEMLMQELNDHRLNGWILEQANATAAGIKPAGLWVCINSEVRIVTATNHRMEMIRSVYLIHCIG